MWVDGGGCVVGARWLGIFIWGGGVITIVLLGTVTDPGLPHLYTTDATG